MFRRLLMINNILLVLFGMLAGYMIASFELALLLVKKGYRSFNEVPENNQE
jgi:hypothetical protein